MAVGYNIYKIKIVAHTLYNYRLYNYRIKNNLKKNSQIRREKQNSRNICKKLFRSMALKIYVFQNIKQNSSVLSSVVFKEFLYCIFLEG